MVAIMKMYKDPKEMVPIIQNPDILGLDFFWYINNYQIFRLLETKVMNQYIIDKWNGELDANAPVMGLATSYCLYQNKNNYYCTKLFSKLWNQITTFEK